MWQRCVLSNERFIYMSTPPKYFPASTLSIATQFPIKSHKPSNKLPKTRSGRLNRVISGNLGDDDDAIGENIITVYHYCGNRCTSFLQIERF